MKKSDLEFEVDKDTQDDDEWAFDRHRDEETIDRFLEERGEPKLFPDESNVY